MSVVDKKEEKSRQELIDQENVGKFKNWKTIPCSTKANLGSWMGERFRV